MREYKIGARAGHRGTLAASVYNMASGLRNLLRTASRNTWYGLREWCGDSAYERYVQAQAAHADKAEVLSRTEFYVEQLNRRYSRPNRCC
jgi:uncharacterized short protein YbdD (DUF466 family)